MRRFIAFTGFICLAWAAAALFSNSSLISQGRFFWLTGNSKYKQVYKEEDRSKLIKFSHKYHAEEVGASCTDCHAMAAKSTSSRDNNLGKMKECYACHDEKKTECKYCHLEAGPQFSAFKVPKRELVFSHEQHAQLGAKCADCHTTIAEKGHNNDRNLPTMESCMTCHDGAKASSDCKTCHTDIRWIKPADHGQAFMTTHKQNVMASGDANCKVCHSEASCQDCHTGGAVEHFKNGTSTTSRGMTGAGESLLNVTQVHSLDFIVTHKFDAKAKTKQCQTCHEVENFCVTCHSQDQRVIRPAWHDASGFVTNGGGMHAALAKKDMENCVTCHESPKSDPTCFRCHTSGGKLK